MINVVLVQLHLTVDPVSLQIYSVVIFLIPKFKVRIKILGSGSISILVASPVREE